jgi:hypothetical protein
MATLVKVGQWPELYNVEKVDFVSHITLVFLIESEILLTHDEPFYRSRHCDWLDRRRWQWRDQSCAWGYSLAVASLPEVCTWKFRAAFCFLAFRYIPSQEKKAIERHDWHRPSVSAERTVHRATCRMGVIRALVRACIETCIETSSSACREAWNTAA